jgi:hypothetical protein
MKNISKLTLSAALAFGLISCGGGKKDDSTTVTNATAVVAAATAENAAKTGMDDANAKMKARRAKGDTLAMPYTDLQKYLPASIDGYTAETPTGASMNMMNMSYSTAMVHFKKDNDWVKVTIVDYNQAINLYNSATAMWSMGLTVDSPEEKANGIKPDNTIGGWQVYKKKTKDATVTLGVGYRFWVQVEANDQADADKVLSIAKSVDLSKLANL